ncbi:MAG: hypothetical protein VKO01_02245 [Cyanobacteriota bacterium]|nr:hypothetical protein [Cyanobacteriota bacterium]
MENDTTSSYKYLLFLSLLDGGGHHQLQLTSPIAFPDLMVEMQAVAARLVKLKQFRSLGLATALRSA